MTLVEVHSDIAAMARQIIDPRDNIFRKMLPAIEAAIKLKAERDGLLAALKELAESDDAYWDEAEEKELVGAGTIERRGMAKIAARAAIEKAEARQ